MGDIDGIFRRYFRPLCLYALHYLNDPDAAEDCVQECFVALWQRMDSSGIPKDLRGYLYSSVRNRCINLITRTKTFEGPSDLEGLISDEEAIARSEIEARLWKAVARLPEKRRRILLMAKRDNMSYAEIAMSLDISENTVRNQVSRALQSLREDDSILTFVLFFF